MSIALTTPQPFERGHGLPQLLYPEVMVVQVDHGIVDQRLVLHIQYGETIAGAWIGSPAMGIHQEVIHNFEGVADGEGGWLEEPDPAYDLLMVSTFASSTTTFLYDEVSAALYQYLLDDGRYVGTINP